MQTFPHAYYSYFIVKNEIHSSYAQLAMLAASQSWSRQVTYSFFPLRFLYLLWFCVADYARFHHTLNGHHIVSHYEYEM